MARAVLGTRSGGGRNGVTQTTRNQTDTLSRTLVSGISSGAYDLYILENSSFFEGEEFVAILDSRTTAICRSLDGNIYAAGEGPRLPIHWGERSRLVPLVSGGGETGSPSFGEWLLGLSALEQDEVLGPERADLFRRDELSLDRFVDDLGRELTLDELGAGLGLLGLFPEGP